MKSPQPAENAKHRDVDLAATAVAILIAIGAAWVGVWPMFEREDNRHRLAVELAVSRGQLASAQSEYGEVRRAIAATSAQLQASTVVLHTADKLAERQDEISETVIAGGIALEQLTVGAVAHGDLLDTIPLRLSGQGTYPQVVAIMHELRARFPDMAITSFQLGAGAFAAGAKPGSEKLTMVRFDLDVEWYTARPDRAGN